MAGNFFSFVAIVVMAANIIGCTENSGNTTPVGNGGSTGTNLPGTDNDPGTTGSTGTTGDVTNSDETGTLGEEITGGAGSKDGTKIGENSQSSD